MLSTPLRRYIDRRTLQNLQQGLLHTLARHITCDGGVVALAGNFIHLVNKDDASLGLLDLVVGCLQQARKDALHILAHIARLGKHRGIDNGEGDLQQLGNGAGDKRLTRTGGTHQHDVRLIDLDVVLLGLGQEAFVVVIDRYGHRTLGLVLADDPLIQKLFDLGGAHQLLGGKIIGFGVGFDAHRLALLVEDAVAVLDAAVADVGSVLTLEQNLHLVALGTAEPAAIHPRRASVSSFRLGLCHSVYFSRRLSTSSIRP